MFFLQVFVDSQGMAGLERVVALVDILVQLRCRTKPLSNMECGLIVDAWNALPACDKKPLKTQEASGKKPLTARHRQKRSGSTLALGSELTKRYAVH